MDYPDLMRGGTAPVKSKPSTIPSNSYNTTRPKTRAVENDFQDTNIDLRTNKIKTTNISSDNGSNNNELDLNKLSLQETSERHMADQNSGRRASSRSRPSKDIKKTPQNGLSAYTQNMPNIVLNTTKRASSKISASPSSPRARGNLSQLNELRAAYGADIPIGKSKPAKSNNASENLQDNEERENKSSSRTNSAVRKKDADITADSSTSNKIRGNNATNTRACDGTASPSTLNKKVRKSTGLTGLLKASFANKQTATADPSSISSSHGDRSSNNSSNRGSPIVMLCPDLHSSSIEQDDSSGSVNPKEGDRNISPLQDSLRAADHAERGGYLNVEELHGEEQSLKSNATKSFDESEENNSRHPLETSPPSAMSKGTPGKSIETVQKTNNEIFPTSHEEEVSQHHIPIIQQAIAIGSSEASLSTGHKPTTTTAANHTSGNGMRIDIPVDDGAMNMVDEELSTSNQRPQTRKLYLGSNNGNQSTGRAPKSAGTRFGGDTNNTNANTVTSPEMGHETIKSVAHANYDYSNNSMFAPVNGASPASYATSPKGSRRIQLKKLSSSSDLNPATSTFWNAASSTATNNVEEGSVATSGNNNGNKFLSPVHRPPSRQKTAFPTHLADTLGTNNNAIAVGTSSNGKANATNPPSSPRRGGVPKPEDIITTPSSANNKAELTGEYEMIEEEFESHYKQELASPSYATSGANGMNTNAGMYLNREPITIPPNSGGSGSTTTTTATNNSSSVDPDSSSHNYYENRPPSRQKVAAQHLFDGGNNANSLLQAPVGSANSMVTTLSSYDPSIPPMRRANSQSRIPSTMPTTAAMTLAPANAAAPPVRGNHLYDPKEDGFLDLDGSNSTMTIPITINNSVLDMDYASVSVNSSRRSSHRNNSNSTTVSSGGNNPVSTIPSTPLDMNPRKTMKPAVPLTPDYYQHEISHPHIRPKSVTTLSHHPIPPAAGGLGSSNGSINGSNANKLGRNFGLVPSTAIPVPPSGGNTLGSYHRHEDSSRSKSANSHLPSRVSRFIDPNLVVASPMGSIGNTVDRIASSPTLLLPPPTASSSTRPNVRPIQGAWSSSTSTTAATINAAVNANNNEVDPRVIPRAQNAFGMEYDSGWTSPSLLANPYVHSNSPENYPAHSVPVRDYNNILLDAEDDEMTILTEDSDHEEDFHPMDHSLSLQSVQLETSLDEDFLKLFAPAGR